MDRRDGTASSLAALAGALVLAAVVAAAPLCAGGVHRIPFTLLAVAAAVAAALVLAASLRSGRAVCIRRRAVLPALFLLLTAAQCLPLPTGLRDRIDPAGAALIDGSAIAADALRPLSLDPPATRFDLAKAGAALAVFLAAAYFAAGRRRRLLAVQAVAVAALAAALLGLGHAILGLHAIYGFVEAPPAQILLGPFVNRNHGAEFLELGAFAAVACAAAARRPLVRAAWLGATAVTAAAALGTLSRTSALALFVGALVLVALRWWRHRGAGALAGHRTLARTGLVLAPVLLIGVGIGIAGGIGAGQLVDRVTGTRLEHETKLAVMRDSFKVVRAHPAGVGRGAFDRVYPVYQTVAARPRFSHVENQPIQLLIDFGLAGLLALAVATAVTLRLLLRSARRDSVASALLAAVVAVLVHNLFDFGLETLGVLLPFSAVLGAAVGRSGELLGEERPGRRQGRLLAGLAMAGTAVGIAAFWHPSADDFDRLLSAASTRDERRALATRAAAAHPVDYFYPLVQAGTEPLRPATGTRSPRMALLNRALSLCPMCADVHREIARALWALGLRGQALREWGWAIDVHPWKLYAATDELVRGGATSRELAALPIRDPKGLLWMARILTNRREPALAGEVIERAREAGASGIDLALEETNAAFARDDMGLAGAAITRARMIAPRDPRVFLAGAHIESHSGNVDGALALLDQGAAIGADDLPIQRFRLKLVMESGQWQRAKRAVDELERALHRAGQPTREARIAEARMQALQGDPGKATTLMGRVLAQEPGNADLWFELGALAEKARWLDRARDAYREASGLQPGNAVFRAAFDRVRVSAPVTP